MRQNPIVAQSEELSDRSIPPKERCEMMSFNKKWLMCVLGCFLAVAAMACLIGYMFEVAPVEGADPPALTERAPLPGRLNELLDLEVGPVGVTVDPAGADVTVGRAVKRCPTCGGVVNAAGVAVTVDPEGVDVTVAPPFCPPGDCPLPGTPDAYPHGELTPSYEENPDYDDFADGGSDPEGGHGGFRGVFKFGGKFRERLQGEGGPLRRLFGKLRGCGG